jgi:hypothetical protein
LGAVIVLRRHAHHLGPLAEIDLHMFDERIAERMNGLVVLYGGFTVLVSSRSAARSFLN